MIARARQQGAALLLAMLTVTLVATLAATALWQQWRGIEIESAERARAQLSWVLTGALDWSRLILREDGRAGAVDHLSEPWALPLSEARLSTFLAQDRDNNMQDTGEAFLSGRITDLQSRMNVLNLVEQGKRSEPAWQAFAKLFRLLGLPTTELTVLAEQLRLASAHKLPQSQAALLPQRVVDLGRLGLSPATLAELAPYITVLPERTTVNLNTASAEVMYANLPGIDFVQAQQLVLKRASSHFRSIDDIRRETGLPADYVDATQVGVATQFFEVVGRLRIEQFITQERSLVERRGLATQVLWREREVLTEPPANPSAGRSGPPRIIRDT